MRRVGDPQRTARGADCMLGSPPDHGEGAAHQRGERFRPEARRAGCEPAVRPGQGSTFTVLLPRAAAVHVAGNADPEQEQRR